jgi:soluble lytic murein transglycosylase
VQIFLRARSGLQESLKPASSEPFDEIWFDEFPATETCFYVKAILRNSILYRSFTDKKVKLSQVLWQDLVVGPNSETKTPETLPQ